jgi:predicted RNA binding protein YcfA (HicA-like mRNA interferase family)
VTSRSRSPQHSPMRWPSAKASRVLATLLRIGWSVKRVAGSHRVLQREGWPDFVFAFHDGVEIGPRMLARVARATGLGPEDL